MQGAGGGFLQSEDGSSQDFADGVDSVWRLSRQVRPGPHPPDECPAPFGPGCEVSGPGALQLGPNNHHPLGFWRFGRDKPLGDGGQEPTVLEDGAHLAGEVLGATEAMALWVMAHLMDWTGVWRG